MKKPTFLKAIFVALILLLSLPTFAQNEKPFLARFDKKLKGDMLLIGNNILSENNNSFNDNSEYNSNVDMKYVDIDGDASTFSSSSADLSIPNASSCYKIVYAGLYWSAILQNGEDRSTINKAKLKMPTGGYNDITGVVIHDAIANPLGGGKNKPYACYADVTALLTDALLNPSPQGTYTMANVIASTGKNGGTGLSAGWSLFVVYEDGTLTGKSITSFDGFSAIDGSTNLNIPISGFKTIPVGPVRAKLAFAALEGDKPIDGDYLQINGNTISTADRPSDNFFNSSITSVAGPFTTRNPKSTNTLGFDAGILNVANSKNGTIDNGDTSATIRLGSTGDVYFYYFTAFAVDIIQPDIVLTKIVKDAGGKDIGNGNVNLGDYLSYTIRFQNIGNDDATSFTIRDQLPTNTIFNYPADLGVLPSGVTVKSYDAITRNIIFNINKSEVEVGDPYKEIFLKVQVVPDCNKLTTACSNSIDNSAYATYKGTLNTDFVISDDPSVNSNTGCLLIPKATNFLVGIDKCKYTKNEVLCKDSVVLTAADGYDSYSWSTSPTGTPVIGSLKTLTVDKVGVYYAFNTIAAPCISIVQEFTVTAFGGTLANPVKPFADEVVICPNDNKELPNIYLCGAGDKRLIDTKITDGSEIIWEKLDETSCSAVTNTKCANDNVACKWITVASNQNFYLANQAGQYRVILKYPGGCFNRYYFNVYQNLLAPTVVASDNICTTKAVITIGNVPSGYEYSLDGGVYQDSNVFPNVNYPAIAAGTHEVKIKQKGVTTNPCIFKVSNILIKDRKFTVDATITQPLCYGNGYKGSVKLKANDVEKQYYYKISKGGILVNSSPGPIDASDYTFANLNAGVYDVEIRTDDGCLENKTIEIKAPDELTATIALTQPLTCNSGEITVYPVGGTPVLVPGPPYYYYHVNGSATAQTSPKITITAAGNYYVEVVDNNNCTVTTTTIKVDAIPVDQHTVTKTDLKCYGDNIGTITLNVANANGYTLAYSIDNGVTYGASASFTGLPAGTYNTRVRYTLGTSVCYDTMVPVTITGPGQALTASAGVSELAGCGSAGEGKVRITNPQGGVAPYTYSFDNGNTYGSINEAYVAPGLYTLYIKDAIGCIYAMTGITLDPVPVAPTITVSSPVFNCNGSANSTVTVTNPASASFSYDYLLNGTLNTNVPSNVFVNVPTGSHTISVEYKLTSVPTYSNLLNEDFGSGAPTTTSGIAPAYCFNDQHVLAPYFCPNPTRSVEDNQYSVASFFWRSDDPSSNNTGAWYHFKDHTTNGVDANGRYLLVNIGGAAGPYGVLYSKPIVDVIPNQPIKVDLYVANLLRSGINGAAPIFRFELVDPSGTVVSTYDTGKIAELAGDVNRDKWIPISLTLNPGANTNLTFKIRSGSIDYSGNDAVIDDIKVYQLPKSCITKKDYPFVVAPGNAFTASISNFKNVSCAGTPDGSITITAQNFNTTNGFQYTIDGTTWTTSLTSPVTITGLTNATYNIQVRYDASATTCKFPFTQVIGAPVALVTGAVVTTPAKCNTGATITASASGGTLAYQFELRDAGGTVIQPFQLGTTFTNVAPGSYIIVTKDANNCTDNIDTAIVVAPAVAPTASLDVTSDLCFDTINQATLVVKTVGGNGTLTYSLDGAAAQNSNTFANVGVGTHNIVVTDSYGCTATISNIIIAPQLAITANLTQDLTCVVNASISGSVSNGYPAYTYTVSRNGAASTAATFPYTTANPGSYVFTVTDNKGCTAVSTAVIVSAKTTPTASFVKTDITCNNANDGTITVTGNNGFGTYTYTINKGAGFIPYQASGLFDNLAAGTYPVKVKDSKGCESVAVDVIIANPTPVAGTISATELACTSTGTKAAVVTVVGSGGSGTYTYSFNGTTNYTTTNTFSTTSPGIVTAYIKDNNGCVIATPLSISIAPLILITDITITSTGLECPANTSHVNIVAVGGKAPLRYKIIATNSGYVATALEDASGNYTALPPGTYTFQAIDKNDCTFNKDFTVSATPAIQVTGNVTTPIKCFGTNGDIQFTVSGTAKYSYDIKNSANVSVDSGNNITVLTINKTNLPADNYTITVTDKTTNCTASYTLNLTQPAAGLTASLTATKINCNNDNAQITVTASGGTTNYTYAVVEALTPAPAASAYGAGNVLTVDTNTGTIKDWVVYVKDANGCETTKAITILSDGLPTIASIPTQCFTGSPLTITLSGTVAIGVPSYGMNGVYQATSTFTINTPNTYTFTIKDQNNCVATTTYIVAPQLNALPVVTTTLDCDVAPANEAIITVTISGGKANYNYVVKNSGGATVASGGPIAGPTFTYSAATADKYTFEITDANNCVVTNTTTVSPITNPTVTANPTNPTCNGLFDGTVQLVPAGGSGGYSYSKDGTSYVATSLFTGLGAGSYTFYVKDNKGCTGSVAVTLTAPTALVATHTVTPFKCSVTNTNVAATITINLPTTGTSPYQYSFNGGGYSNTNTLTVNDNGTDQTVKYTVRDKNGCTTAEQTITLFKLNPPRANTITHTAVTCTTTTSTVTVTPTVGTGVTPLTYVITSPASATTNTTGAGSGIFTGLLPDTYVFKVTDANGCYYTQSHVVNAVVNIAVSGSKNSDVLCNGGSTGTITFNVSGNATVGNYTYALTVGAGTITKADNVLTLANVAAGTYTVQVTDTATGCIANASVTINQPAAALTATYTTVNANCFTATSKVTVTASGGTPGYLYSFVQDGAAVGAYTSSNIANLNAATNTNWDVYIKDGNGCITILDVTIVKDATPTVTATAVGQCFGVGTYTITATPGLGLVAPLSYSINGGASYQAGNTFVISATGNYTVIIKDGNGCTATSNVVTVYPTLTLTSVLNKDITCSAPVNAQVTLTAVGGNSASYTYEYKESAGAYTSMPTNVFNTAVAGSYTFRVTDANGCIAVTTTPIIITTPVNPDITGVTQTQTIKCYGDSAAAISIAIDNTKGLSPFVFNVLNTTTGQNFGTQTSGLTAGNYTITVTDAKGCTDTFPIAIIEPTAIDVAHHAVPITCGALGVSKGSVIVDSVTGGTGPYNYFVTGVNGYNASELNNLGTTSVSFNVVDFGLYQINVVDTNGCSVLIKDVLVASPPTDLDISITAAANCLTGGSAVVAIGASSSITGTGPFYFSIYTGTAPAYPAGTWLPEDAVGSKKTTFNNLVPGVTYTFVVYDSDVANGGTGTGCYYYETASAPIPTNSTLVTSAVVANNITCTGSNDGKVSFNVTSIYPVATNVTYEIFNAQSLLTTGITGAGIVPANGILTVSNLGPLPFGNYFVLVKEAVGSTNAGCSVATVNFNITQSAFLLAVSASVSKNANCNPNSGVITAVAKDGTAPYTYQLLFAADPIPTAASAGWGSANTFNTNVAGSYIVYAKDAYGCIKSAPVTLVKDADPKITAPATICYDGNAFTIAITGTVDPAIVGGATYSVNGSAFQSSPNFTFNAAGTYNLVIKDGNGCTATVAYEVKPQLQLSVALTKELDCTGTPNANITLTATGGYNASYTYDYSIDGGTTYTVMPTNVLSTGALGNYIFRVTDAKTPTGCTATATFTLDPIPTTVFTTTTTNVTCNGGNNGSITVNVTSGFGPFEYQLDGGLFQTSNEFLNLIAGNTYVITVRDAKSCTFTNGAITITQPAVLTATSLITTPLSCGVGNEAQPATVTVTGAGGTALYTYSFDGGANYTSTNTYQSYVGITFNVFVKDANGCMFTFTNGVNIPALDAPRDLGFSATAILCAPAASTTSTVTVTVPAGQGGVAPFTYNNVTSGTSNGTGVFAGLIPGDYLFEVVDANNCKYQESFTIKPVTNITVSGLLISDVTCNPGSNGAVRFTVGKFAGTYSYTINGGIAITGQNSATINVTGLTATSTQTIVVTDEITGCTATTFIDVVQPAALTLVQASNINANCNFGAKVSVTASGGVAPYSYSYVISGVGAGTYSSSASAVLDPATSLAWDVYVKDANNCVITTPLTINIVEDTPPIVDPIVLQCYTGSPLSVKIKGSGIGTLQYGLNGVYQLTDTFAINAPGSYKLSIKDGNGCITEVDYVVKDQLLLSAALTKDLDCKVSPDAVITLTPSGGTGTYSTYAYSTNGGGSYTLMASNVLTTPTAGTYIFRVTDNQVPACPVISNAIIVTPKTVPDFTTTQTNVSCNGGSDGTITITAANGIAPYQYSINNGGTFQASNIFKSLNDAGTYTVVVKDSKDCLSVPVVVDITQPVALAASAVVTPFGCNLSNTPKDAIVTITATNGTAPYSYSFDNGGSFGTSNAFTVNTPQTVSYVVLDKNGCQFPGTAVVNPFTPPTDMTITATPIYCNTAGGVSEVRVTGVTGGSGAYTYEIISPIIVAPSASNVFSNLLPNTYQIKVTDATGCSTIKSIVVVKANEISVSAQLLSAVLCNGGNTGSVAFTVANYITPANYSYTLMPALGVGVKVGDVVTYTGLITGKYTFTVTDNTSGCVAKVIDFLIAEPALALDFTTVATNINCNNDNANITVTVKGGTPSYGYAVVKSSDPAPTVFSTNNVLVVDTNNGAVMNWDVYVKDANGCPVNKPQTIVLDPKPTISSVLAANQCPSATGTYDITVTATGVAPLEYSIDGVGFQTNNIITVNAPGTYNITVRDGNACTTTAAAMTILPALQLQAAINKMPTCNSVDGEITLTASGGSGILANYEYSKDGVAPYGPGSVFSGFGPGSYTLFARDKGTNCIKTVLVKIETATTITGFALEQTPVTCNGGSDGRITATLAAPSTGVNDNPVYMYSLAGTVVRAPQASNIFSGLPTGNYTVTVTSGRICNASLPITVGDVAIITVPVPTVVQYGCTAGTNGTKYATITVSGVTGGSGTYSIYEFIKSGIVLQSGPNTSYTESDLTGGTYTVNVYDNKGCLGSVLAPSLAPFISINNPVVAVSKGITCVNSEEITVTATVVGGVPSPALNYTVQDVVGAVKGGIYNQTNTTGVFTGLTVGNYIVTVANPTTGCSVQTVHYVNEPNTFGLEVDKIADVKCFGSSEGSVKLTFVDRQPLPTNEAGAFTYSISGPTSSGPISVATAGPVTISGLKAGNYTVSAKLNNSPECSVSYNFTIDQPTAALAITATHTKITCVTGNNDGTISVTATGGWNGGYQFELVGPVNVAYSAQTNFTGLTAGSYTVNVKDSKGCIVPVNVTLVNPAVIAATVSTDKVLLSCFGDQSATITASNVSGGSGSYWYTLVRTAPDGKITKNGPQQTASFSKLGAGSYIVSISDNWSCFKDFGPIVINQPTVVVASLAVKTTATCTVTPKLLLEATGGTAPYTYSTDDVTYNSTSFASSVTITLPFVTTSTVYKYYVKDANGCKSYITNDIKLDPVPALVIVTDVTNAKINCAGETTGVIVAKAQGGLGNYVYSLLNGTGAVITPAPKQTSPGNFTELPKGDYLVKVVSGDCSTTSTAKITISEPAAAVTAISVPTPITCNGSGNGKITVNAAGGTGAIRYAITPNLNQFFTTNTFLNLKPGLYDIISQDENGCFVFEKGIEIKEPNAIATTTVATVDEICFGDKDGSISIAIAGGVAPYSVKIDDVNAAYITGLATQTQFDFPGLVGGSHTIYIQDANLCTTEWKVDLAPSVLLDPKAVVAYGCLNNAPSNTVTVSIDASITNAADVDYALDGGSYQASNVFANVAAGTHVINARHTNGCIQPTAAFIIDAIAPLEISLKLGGLNEIVATATGGSGTYQFTFAGEATGTKNTYIYYKSGDYIVTVTDANGCVATATMYFEFIDIEIPNIFTPDGNGTNDKWEPLKTINYKDLEFLVFDRYGRKLATFGQGESWDGKYNGAELPSGDYWYILKLNAEKDAREFVGHFTLYR